MAKQHKLTQKRFDELRDELNYLKTVREKEVAEQIKEARSFGDLSENSEYDEAKNEQGKVYSRIAELTAILSSYEIISEDDAVGLGHVRTGATVVVEDMEDGTQETYQIVGSQDADPNMGRISDESPFGKALLGHAEGDVVSVHAPMGILKYKLVEIK